MKNAAPTQLIIIIIIIILAVMEEGEEEGEEEVDSFKRALLEVVSSSRNLAALDASTSVLGIE